jgi:Druantia protein DruA/DDE_Tnp_1-associated
MNVQEVVLRPVGPSEERDYQELMEKHHYLGALTKIGETLWYVAMWHDQWVGLISFSAAAWKCEARDRWIGWSFRHQYDRLKLVVNNSRFLILPDWHIPNLGSRILALCEKRLPQDWQERFGHPVLLLETFVDPSRFQGTVYRAANWTCVGLSKGYRRVTKGYADAKSPKMVFLKPLQGDAQSLLCRADLDPPYHTGDSRLMLSADQMYSLPRFFADIPDPRRRQGRRHRLATVLAIAAASCLCGMRGYKAMADWAKSLGPKARGRLGCRLENGRRVVPSESIIRNVLIRVDPVHLDRALNRWNEAYGKEDTSLAIDGKTMCNAINENGQAHIMSVIGHETKTCYTQKKWAACG